MSKICRSYLSGFVICVALLCAAPLVHAGLFNTVETTHEGLAPFPKWTGALERYFEDNRDLPGDCTEHGFNACHMERWQSLLDDVAKDPKQVQLNKINRYMNDHRYIVDRINWGVEDYWAIPQQFLKRFGDCEDFAIAKYLSLRALGWPVEAMRIVVLQDLNLRVAHAILIVDFEGKTLVLDNQISMVIGAEKIHHYRPIFSLNEQGWWRHRSPTSMPVPTQQPDVQPRRIVVVAENMIVEEANEKDSGGIIVAETDPAPTPETIPEQESEPDKVEQQKSPENPLPGPEKSWWQRFWDWLSGLFD